jgi:hypothetical protein
MVEIVWHRRETRRQQRRQTSTCTTRRTRSTHQMLAHMLMIHGMTSLFHQNRNNLVCFVRFMHIEISLIYEPIINTDSPNQCPMFQEDLKEKAVSQKKDSLFEIWLPGQDSVTTVETFCFSLRNLPFGFLTQHILGAFPP